jgi:hypothetical protein
MDGDIQIKITEDRMLDCFIKNMIQKKSKI